MKNPKPMIQNGHHLLDTPNIATKQTQPHFYETLFKNTGAEKLILNKRPSNLTVASGTKIECAHATELNHLKEAILLLKNDILVKEEEIGKLKLKLGNVQNNMEEFSYVASHDLKEPLRMVTSYLGLLKNKFGSQLDQKANTYIDFAIDGGARLHTMFNGLLDLSQIGRIEECRRILPFNEIIEEVQINISKKIKEAKAEINVVSKMPLLEVYERSVIKLMENLLCNAIKFSKPGETPVVEISAREKETGWEFCISDNGIGIEPNNYKQIFAVFSKLHNCAAYPGNGIGLAICKKAVEHHGGAMWVTAEINKGSKFYFTLPK